MSVATFSLWVACYLLTLTFPIFVEQLNAANTFWIYAVVCITGFVVILKYLPETKGISLEELERKLVGKPDSFNKKLPDEELKLKTVQ